MTDNEIIWYFKNGCSLLNNDDVDGEDMRSIRKNLENCAENMADVVHKHITQKICQQCTSPDKYGHCKVWDQCKYKIDRPLFSKRKKK